jgi:primosomal protein N' (replication factor Y) (superfamily II helicase)
MPPESAIDSLFGPAPAAAVVDVLVPVALDKAYSYRADMPLAPGDIVAVPLGPRETLGVVWDRDPDAPAGTGANLKAVTEKFDWPPLPSKLRRFIDWVAAYTLAPRGMVARMALRDPASASPEKPRYGLRLTGNHPGKITPARGRVLLAAKGGFAFGKSELAKQAGVSTGVIDALVDAEVLEAVALPPEPAAPTPDAEHAPAELSDGQRAAADALIGRRRP